MSESIKDGTGQGYVAKVDENFRLYTSSVTVAKEDNSSLLGDSYNLNTGIINLTSANKSAGIYLSNNETRDIVITGIFYLIGNSTGGSGDMLITVLRNPTEGTIVSNEISVEINSNRNFGSSNVLSASVYKGAEGYTFTNGTKILESIFSQSPTRSFINPGSIRLPKGTSIGVEITPASGNTSLDVEFAFAIHLSGD